MNPIIQPLIIAISSRALFDLDASNHIFETQGVQAYAQHQIQQEETLLAPGVAFPLVQKLLQLNQNDHLVEVILLSRNSPDTSLRIRHSIQHYKLNITRAVFTNGDSPYRYIKTFGAQLFLSANPIDVQKALEANCAAATLLNAHHLPLKTPSQLRIAFDGDSVLFSDESEKIYQQHGLQSFIDNERLCAKKPLNAGPFKGFLEALQHLQQHFMDQKIACPIRTALVTARCFNTHERVVRTLRQWGIRIDEAMFLGGLSKGEFLQVFGADIYFDDQQHHCNSAKDLVTTGHVPHGCAHDIIDY